MFLNFELFIKNFSDVISKLNVISICSRAVTYGIPKVEGTEESTFYLRQKKHCGEFLVRSYLNNF